MKSVFSFRNNYFVFLCGRRAVVVKSSLLLTTDEHG